MREFARAYREYLANPFFRSAAAMSLLMLAAGVTFNFFAGRYATIRASNYVEDIVLSNIPVMNIDGFFVVGTFVIVIFISATVLRRPHWIPFTCATLGLFYFVRAIFISLTHLGPFPDRIEVLDWGAVIAKFIGGSDMFFSGHTGAPFLLALIFWNMPMLRYAFLAWSVFFAVTVLLGHVHYTIDVFSAYFITYTIFHLGEFFFARYRALFHNGLEGMRRV